MKAYTSVCAWYFCERVLELGSSTYRHLCRITGDVARKSGDQFGRNDRCRHLGKLHQWETLEAVRWPQGPKDAESHNSRPRRAGRTNPTSTSCAGNWLTAMWTKLPRDGLDCSQRRPGEGKGSNAGTGPKGDRGDSNVTILLLVDQSRKAERNQEARCRPQGKHLSQGRRKGVILTGNWWKESSLRIVDDTSGFEAGNWLGLRDPIRLKS